LDDLVTRFDANIFGISKNGPPVMRLLWNCRIFNKTWWS